MLLSKEQPKKRDLGAYLDTLRDCGLDAKAISVLHNIRALERNPLMHPEDYLSQDDAINIFNISVAAFDRLIVGVGKINPFPPK
jgi:hypothetical protein